MTSATDLLSSTHADLAKAPSPEGVQLAVSGADVAWEGLSDTERARMRALHEGKSPNAGAAPTVTTIDDSAIAQASVTPEERAAAEAALEIPARPVDYRMPDPPAGVERLAPEDDTMLRGFFHTNAIEQREATWITTEVYRAAKQMQKLADHGDPSTLKQRTADAIRLTGNQCAAELVRVWGAEYETKMATARAEAARLTKGHPELYRILAETTLGNSVPLIRLLVERAERRKG